MQPLLADTPNLTWTSNVAGYSAKNPDASFYSFKVWFAEAEISRNNIERSFLKYPAFRNSNKLSFYLFYKKNAPEIQCDVYSTPAGLKVSFSFPLNNCLFSPDYNSDNKINQEDVTLALEQLKQRKNDPRSEKLINSGINGISISKSGELYLTTTGKVYYAKDISSKWREIKVVRSRLKEDYENSPHLERISFFNNSIGIISGYISTEKNPNKKDGLFRSDDRGKTWQNISFGGDQWIYDSFVTNNGEAWIGGSSGAIYYSNDYGKEWRALQSQPFNSETRMHRIFMKNTNVGIAGALANELKITKDNWKTFSVIETPMDQRKVKELIHDDSRINNALLFNNLIIVSQSEKFFYSDKNNISWKPLPGNIIKIELDIPSNTLYGINADRKVIVFNNKLTPTILNDKALNNMPLGFKVFNGNAFILDEKYGVYFINAKEFRFAYPEI